MKGTMPVFTLCMLVVAGFIPLSIPAAAPQERASMTPGEVDAASDALFGEPQASPPGPYSPKVSKIDFPIDCYLIPMDDKQTDVIRAFGVIHAILRNNTTVNRIIEPLPPPNPANIIIKTVNYPAGAAYAGGPVLCMPIAQPVIDAIKMQFPTVYIDRTTEAFSCDRTFVVAKATNILLLKGIYGHTEELLDDMGIPYDSIGDNGPYGSPSMIFDYNLIVDDCGASFSPNTKDWQDNITRWVEEGNEFIYTDRSLYDFFDYMPWKNMVTSIDGTPTMPGIQVDVDFHNLPDFPAQYSGKSTLTLYQMYASLMATTPIDSRVQVMADCQTYEGNASYRILAFYFYWGSRGGIVEFFGYHPAEQTIANTGDPDAYKLASFLYGNKFVHTPPADFGVTSKSLPLTTQTVAKEGTGNTAADEQATFTISLFPSGDDVRSSNSLKVNYTLMPYIGYVAGSAKDQFGNARAPTAIYTLPNGTKCLYWSVDQITKNTFWNVTFKVTSSKDGLVYVNQRPGSYVQFYDLQGMLKTVNLSMMRLNVTIGTLVPEIAWLLPFAGAAAAVFIVRRRKSA